MASDLNLLWNFFWKKKRRIHGIPEICRKKRRDRVANVLAWSIGDVYYNFLKKILLVFQQPLCRQNYRLWSIALENISDSQRYDFKTHRWFVVLNQIFLKLSLNVYGNLLNTM